MEKWLPVVYFEGLYEVSDLGRVRSVRRNRLMKLEGVKGYRRVMLSVDGVTARHFVHAMVMRAFVGPCPPGHEINHKRGDRSDNRLSMLEYVTPSQNNKHAYDVLKKVPQAGSKHGMSKLTEAAAREIRDLRANGSRLTELADAFGVSITTISEACNRRHWTHVT